MKYKQKMIGVDKGKEKSENALWTKISKTTDNNIFLLKQFDGETLDTIALTRQEINNIINFID